MKTKRILSAVLAVIMMMTVMTACGEAKPEYAYDDEAPSLCEAYADYFNIGAAINSWDESDPAWFRFPLQRC